MTERSPAVGARSWHRVVPSLVTSLRIAAVPAIWTLWARDMRPVAIGLYGLVVLSDALDGWLARRLGSVTRFGAFFDAIADIVVILSLLALLCTSGISPLWLPVAPLALAGIFLATSSRAAPLYDPIGKYYGAVLYVVVGALLWGVGPRARAALCVVVPVASVAVLVSRWITRSKATANVSN